MKPLFRRRLHKFQKDWARFSPSFFSIISSSVLSDKITIVLLNIIALLLFLHEFNLFLDINYENMLAFVFIVDSHIFLALHRSIAR